MAVQPRLALAAGGAGEPPDDPPLPDELAKAIEAAEARGLMTYSELDAALPDNCTSHMIEAAISVLMNKGIELIQELPDGATPIRDGLS
jgi:Sigma-70 factor, region 1.1